MAEIVNLRQVRKNKSRAEREKAAEENRRKFGRTKAERRQQAAETGRAQKSIESHRRDPDN